MVTRSRKYYKRIFVITIFCLLFTTIVWGAKFPNPTREFYVNDYANILDHSHKQYILSRAEELEKVTTAQVVVVTVKEIEDGALEDYSLGLLREWEIGDKKASNGVLILLDVGGRQSRIEVGFGLEGVLPDGKTGRIQDTYMIPYYQSENYSKGITEGFDAIVNEIYIEYGYEDRVNGEYKVIEEPHQIVMNKEGIPPVVIIVGLLIVIPLILLDFKLTGGAITYMLIRILGRGGGRGGNSGSGSGRSGRGGSGGGGGSSRRF